MDFELGTVVAITVISYLIGMAAKAIPNVPNQVIPVLCGVVGGVLGVVGMYIMPDFPVNDVLSALAVGIVSGLAATGVNQVGKQMMKRKDEINENCD